MGRWVTGVKKLVGAVCVAILVVVPVVFPQVSWGRHLSTVIPVAQIVAFPGPLGVAVMVLGAVLVLVAALRRWARFLVAVGLVLLLVGVLFVVFPAGVCRPAAPMVGEGKVVRELTVVTFNTQAKLVPGDLSRLLNAYDPDIVVLPETSTHQAESAAHHSGFPGVVFGTPVEGFTARYHGGVAPTSVLVHARLGRAEVVSGPPTTLGTVAVRFEDSTIPTVVGVHTAPPLPGLMSDWKNDLARVIDFSDSFEGPLVVAGDFNATLRHGAMTQRKNMVDSAQLCHGVPEGTWPTSFPRFLRSQIDHVFVSPDVHASGCEVVDVGASDHAAYVTTVAGVTP